MERYKEKIGCLVHIPNVGRGKLKYLGPVEGKPGIYAGVDLLANIGKNNGSFGERQYFESEYPHSGLFVQLEKLIPLIESTYDSKKDPLAIESSPQNEKENVQNKERNLWSSETTIQKTSTGNNQQSPTLVNNLLTSSDGKSPKHDDFKTTPSSGKHESKSSLGYSDVDGDVCMSALSSKDAVPYSEYYSSKSYRDQQLRIEKHEKEIMQYKKLLNEQRVLLEELQPAIEEYEKNMLLVEKENQELRYQLIKQQEQQEKQKQFFEGEHEQLLTVVEELHKQMKSNERYFKNSSGTCLPKD